MEVLNKKERRKAYIAFVIFFVITVSLFTIAAHFNYYMPIAENKALKAENEKLAKEFEYQTKFAIKIDSVKTVVDSINAPKQDNDFQQRLANVMLADIYQKFPKDTAINKKMYNNIILAYKKIIDYKKEIRSLTHNAQLLDSLRESSNTYKAELEKVRLDLDICRQIYQNQ